MSTIVEREQFPVARLNRECFCIGADLDALRDWLQQDLAQRGFSKPVVETHPHLFSALPVFVSREHVTRMRSVIAAVESVVALPAYQAAVLDRAPAIARFTPRPRGVFFGYDFQLGDAGPQLIEINTDPSLTQDVVRERFRVARDQIRGRIQVLAALLDLPEGPLGQEFHASIRVKDLARSVRFYAWLLKTWPKEWTHRYATFIRPDLDLNFVLLVSDGKTLHHDTLYHLGVAVPDRAAVIDAYHRATRFGAPVEKPPRITWKGTPLHELWLTDPDGNLIEIYARLMDAERARKPADEAPEFLVAGAGQCR